MIGQKIYYFRKSKGMTQEQLAHGICSIPHLSKIENGHETPSQDTLIHLCNRLGVTLDDIDTTEEIKQLKELLDNWYSLMVNKDREQANFLYSSIPYKLHSVQDPVLLLTYKLYYIRYVLIHHDLDEAEIKLTELKEYQKNFNQEMTYYFNLVQGVFNYLKGNFIEALFFFKMAEQICNELRLKDAEMYYLLALTHSQLHDITFSINYAKLALDLFNQNIQYNRSIECEILIGINNRRLKNFAEAEKHFLNALKASKSLNLGDLISNCYHHLGVLYQDKDSEKAIHFFLESLKYYDIYNYLRNEDYVRTCLGLAEVYYHVEEYNEMRLWIDRGEQIALTHGLTSLILQFRVLRCIINDYDEEEKEHILKEEVLPYFTDKKMWNFVSDYAELLAELYTKKYKYKRACQYYKLVIDTNKRIHT